MPYTVQANVYDVTDCHGRVASIPASYSGGSGFKSWPGDRLIALMVEAVSTSETSVKFETTQRSITEGCHPHTRRRENLKSHILTCFFMVFLSLCRKMSEEYFKWATTASFHILSNTLFINPVVRRSLV
jgi:hypothetical protein